MNSNALRRKSTKRVYLARVRACIVWAAMLSHVGDQTYREWRKGNYFVRTAMTSTFPQAAVSKALMVCFPLRLPSSFLMGANLSTRRFLWHYIRPSFLPHLSR